MTTSEELKQHINSPTDFYALLSTTPSASSSELRRAYRKTALKYHPDKVGPSDTAALEKFHLLQIAYDVLSDPDVKAQYDNARRAKQQASERAEAFEGRRRGLKEDLEARERAGGIKRKRDGVVFGDGDMDEGEREIKRLAEDGRRRVEERREMLRREAEALLREEEEDDPSRSMNAAAAEDVERSITLRFPQHETTAHMHREAVVALFERFGKVEDAVLRDKKVKIEGQKHRQPYTTALLVFEGVIGAHAAVTEFSKASEEDDRLSIFEAVGWAGGKEPDCIPKARPTTATSDKDPSEHSQKKVPAFSFRAGPKVSHGPDLDDITMIRLKNAERRRVEEKIRREEAAEDVGLM